MKKYNFILFLFIILVISCVYLYKKNNQSKLIIETKSNPLQEVFGKINFDSKHNNKFQNKTLKEQLNIEDKVQLPQNIKTEAALDILRSQYEQLKKAFYKSKNPNVKDSFDFTIAMYATMFNDLSMLKKLFDANIDISDEDSKIMIFLVMSNKIFTQNMSKKQIVDFDIKNDKIVNLFLEQKMDFSANSFEDYPMLNKFTPLTLASRFGNTLAIKSIINNGGVDINGKSKDGKTLLMDTLKYKNKDIISFLLENGSSIDDEDFNGKSVAHYAYETGSLEIIKQIDPNGENVQKVTNNGTNSLMLASKRGDKDTIDYFLDKGININKTNDDGYSALLEAVRGANFESVKYLVQKGSDIDIKTLKNQNLLILASRGEYLETPQSQRPKVSYEMMEYIYNLTKPNINAIDGIGSTALIAAAASNNIQAVKFLLNHGADTKIQNDRGYTAIGAAQFYNNNEIIRLITEHTAKNKK